MIKFILLGLLDYSPMTGYELKQTIDTSTAHFWHAHHSQIYTTLRQMEKEGLVTSVFVREDDALKRRVYSLTETGRKMLDEWLDSPMTEVTPIKEDFLVRIFFSAKRDPQKVLAELVMQRQLHQSALRSYEKVRENIPTHGHEHLKGGNRNPEFWGLTLDMGFLYEKMYLEWLDKAIQITQKY
jgi:PadR family transcriptional regulator, regulatory protein AphA